MRDPITHDVEDQLERLVDRHGLAAVLDSIQELCLAKAIHLRSAWQDEQSASVWEVERKRLERAQIFAQDVGI